MVNDNNLENVPHIERDELTAISYHAYHAHHAHGSTWPPKGNAHGYARFDAFIGEWWKLKDDERYAEWEDENDDEPTPADGYAFVYSEVGDEWFVIREEDIYTEIFQHNGLYGGWGMSMPDGNNAYSSYSGEVDATTTDEDGETIYLAKWRW